MKEMMLVGLIFFHIHLFGQHNSSWRTERRHELKEVKCPKRPQDDPAGHNRYGHNKYWYQHAKPG